TARRGRDRVVGGRSCDPPRAHRRLGRRLAAGSDRACRAPRPGAVRGRVLRQRADVRNLLLRTSVLERVNGPLADILTGGTGSERILQNLEEGNAFVAALDAGRSWFRYHHLFADLLRLELRRTDPGRVDQLHQ